MPTVLLAGTLDTKGTEYGYVRDRLRARGLDVLVMDLGVLGEPPFAPDITASEVARAGGAELAALRAARDRGPAIDAMLRGARALVPRLHADGRVHGVLGLGGSGGTAMITAAMRALPIGVPKLMLSTMASGQTAQYVDVSDLTLMPSVIDIAGLNPLSRRILANAAAAIAGMVEQAPIERDDAPRPLLAATMFGVTTPCVTAARQRLEAAGYDVLVFHATGTGGRAMESLIASGFITGVLDVTTTEWCDEVVGGVLAAGPDRHGAAARRGIPQVVSTGALDMVNFHAMDTVPERFAGRTFYRHTPEITLMRTTADENRTIARRIAAQLARSAAPVTLVVPLRGISMIDAPGQPFHDPAADRALFETLREAIPPEVRWVEVDAHINDPAFAEALVSEMLAALRLATPADAAH
ncbi:MAG: Tm-1-like ATP-binding domain-containing protein [Deltaproteobacteria bacterium]